jgi:hypothetical protein
VVVRRLALPALFVIGLALTIVASAAALGSAGNGAPTAMSRAALVGVNFVNTCGFSHRATDDPIVFPGQPGRSHDHSFVGARTTSAFSSLSSLAASASSCTRAGHTAAYWMPSLVVDGVTVAPVGATIYYRRNTLAPVTAFPAGFRVIAGNAKATSPQGRTVTSWNCGVAGDVRASATVPQCPPGRATALRLHVTFPSCWDGRNLDATNHQSHTAYAVRGRCPSSHPVAVPAITLIYRYPSISGASVALASGGQLSAHADFLNSWDQSTLQSLVDGCLNALRACKKGS